MPPHDHVAAVEPRLLTDGIAGVEQGDGLIVGSPCQQFRIGAGRSEHTPHHGVEMAVCGKERDDGVEPICRDLDVVIGEREQRRPRQRQQPVEGARLPHAIDDDALAPAARAYPGSQVRRCVVGRGVVGDQDLRRHRAGGLRTVERPQQSVEHVSPIARSDEDRDRGFHVFSSTASA